MPKFYFHIDIMFYGLFTSHFSAFRWDVYDAGRTKYAIITVRIIAAIWSKYWFNT